MSVSEVKGKSAAQEARQKTADVEKPAPKKQEEAKPEESESRRPALAKA